MAVRESEVIGKSEALSILRQGRDSAPAKGAAEPATNPVSEAARTLGQRGAEARRQREAPATDKPQQTQRTAPSQDKPDDEPEDNAEEAPEGQDVEEEQPDTAEVEASDDNDGDKATIEIDGEKLTKQEIRDSYLRRDDYTRKTQELADRGKSLDAALGAVTQNSQKIEQLVTMLEQAVGQEPDWGTLAMQMEPQRYLAYKENWNQQKQVLSNVRAEQQRSFMGSIQQAKAAMIDEAANTFRPEWKDAAKRQEGITTLANFAVSKGILPQELQMLHRTPMLGILDDAFKWNELQKTQRITDKKVQGKPKPVKPGAQRTQMSAAENALQSERQLWESNKRPSVKDSLRWVNAKRSYEQSTGKRA